MAELILFIGKSILQSKILQYNLKFVLIGEVIVVFIAVVTSSKF